MLSIVPQLSWFFHFKVGYNVNFGLRQEGSTVWVSSNLYQTNGSTYTSTIVNGTLGMSFLWTRYQSKHVAISGREPWSSGYGRRLMFWRSWVQIPAPNTGWTFFTFICCKNVFFWKDKKKWKSPRMAHFFEKNRNYLMKCAASICRP